MSRTKALYRCGECGTSTPKWAGRCATCEAWNSLVEELERADGPVTPVGSCPPVVPIGEVDAARAQPCPTGLPELDRVLGGGLVPGSVTLLGGEPGIGKSTLLLQLLAGWPGRTLYVSAEESAQQVRMRAERLGAVRPDLFVVPATALAHVLQASRDIEPTLLVVDSIQSIADSDVASAPGSVTQVRHCAHVLVNEAKASGLPVVLVGHVTKDGALAGPRVLEHVVDTVLAFEGDRHHALRLLRAVKHRFGSTQELGVFEMTGGGLKGVPDASRLFLSDRRTGVPGSAVVPLLEGQRPMLVEVQALTNAVTGGAPPRRSAQGLDTSRLAMLLAVLERRARLPLTHHEVYVSAVGGVRLADTGADLAVCMALAGALTDTPLPPDLVVIGEVGLAGEIRQVAHTARRLNEAARMGFTRAVVPVSSPAAERGPQLVRVATVSQALAAVGLSGILS